MAEPRPSSQQPIKTGLFKSPYEPGGGIEQEVSYVADEIIIKYKDTATEGEIASFETAQRLDKIEPLPLPPGVMVYLTPTDPIQLVEQFKDDPIIEYIEPNLIRRRASSPTSEVERTATGTSDLQAGSLVGIAVVVGLFLLLRK
jgi:hypothetical protein